MKCDKVVKTLTRKTKNLRRSLQLQKGNRRVHLLSSTRGDIFVNSNSKGNVALDSDKEYYASLRKNVINAFINSRKTQEQKDIGIRLSHNASFKPYDISSICDTVTNPEEYAKLVTLIDNPLLIQKTKQIDKIFGKDWAKYKLTTGISEDYYNTYKRALQYRITPESLDVERIKKLYKTLKDYKVTLSEKKRKTIEPQEVSKLFNYSLFSTMDILDDNVIKYATKLKLAGLEDFIFNVHQLKYNGLSKENYELLGQKIAAIPNVNERFQKLETMTTLSRYTCSNNNDETLSHIVGIIDKDKELNSFLTELLFKEMNIQPDTKMIEKMSFNDRYIAKLIKIATQKPKLKQYFTEFIKMFNDPNRSLIKSRARLVQSLVADGIFDGQSIDYQTFMTIHKGKNL